MALLVGDREAVSPKSARGPTGSPRLSPEARVVPFPQLEKEGRSEDKEEGREGSEGRRPGEAWAQRSKEEKLREEGSPEAEAGQKEREEEREEASYTRRLRKHRLG